jgi:hypothetical protein
VTKGDENETDKPWFRRESVRLAVFFGEAFDWGSATHGYIDDRLKAESGLLNISEVRNPLCSW